MRKKFTHPVKKVKQLAFDSLGQVSNAGDMAENTEGQPGQPTPAPQAGLFKRVFYHPNFNVVSGLFGIIGTLLAVYFYYASEKEPDLTYYVSPTRIPILQQGNLLNNLSVTYQGAEIKGDLSTVEIQIWNQGKQSIRRENILKPITIKTPNGEKIYQTHVSTTRDIVGFNWINTTNNQGELLSFDWNILEHDDGIKLQIIYGGSARMPLLLGGIIEGQPKGITPPIYTNNNKAFFYVLASVVGGFIAFIFSMGLGIRTWRTIDAKTGSIVKFSHKIRGGIEAAFAIIFSFAGLTLYIYTVIKINNMLQSTPPFGP